jgi:SNF2 family DNA or RNA helicase
MIGAFVSWANDGTLDQRNGKALFVVPASLRGNIPTEIRIFCDNPEEMISKTEVMSYEQFQKTPHSELEQYGAIFFDEAQKLKNAIGNNASKVGEHAMELNHPHKVLATASVLEKGIDDLYSLYMIANNEFNTGKDEAEKEKKTFMRDNCVMSGGRAVGIKNNPNAIARIHEWTKTNFMYVTKESVRDEISLKGVTPNEQQTKQVVMSPNISDEYNKIASKIKGTLQRMQEKYRDREVIGVGDLTGEISKQGVMEEIIQLRELSNDPQLFFEKRRKRKLEAEYEKETGNLVDKKVEDRLNEQAKKEILDEYGKIPNPKIERAGTILDSAVSRGKKVAVWTDQPQFASKAAKELNDMFPSRSIAICLADEIYVLQNGKVTTYDGSEVKRKCVPVQVDGAKSCTVKAQFKKSKKYVFPDGSPVPEKQWQKYIMDYVLKGDSDIAAVLLTKSYATGHNLQWISSVVHLDRDSWNNEVMKQRTARCYRQGQKEDVTVEIIDSIVDEEVDAISINEAQRWMMEMENEIFDRVVRDSMSKDLDAIVLPEFGTAQKKIDRDKDLSPEMLNFVLNPNTDTASEIHGVNI